MSFTVLGACGFIGSALLKRLAAQRAETYAPGRDDLDWKRNLGHVIYAIGLTADFRDRPLDTVDAHVHKLAEVLRRGRFDTLTYLSSTRVYRGTNDTRETANLSVRPAEGNDVYNISKLMGEALCLAASPAARIVRLANVYGFDPDSDNFLPAILRAAATGGEVRLHTALDSCKDYVAVEDVADVVLRIAASARARLYNVASGRNVTHREIADTLTGLGVRVSVDPAAPVVADPVVRVGRVVEEFGLAPQPLLPRLPKLYADFAAHFSTARARGSGA